MKPSDEIRTRIDDCRQLDDESLRRDLRFLAQREHHSLGTLLIHLGEYDRRRLSEEEGYQSTYSYCVKCLGYDESGAYRRIQAARVCKRYPHILDFIMSGELSLSSLLLLSPVLTDSNQEILISQARGKSKRELETHLAELDPRPATPDAFHRMPAPPMWMTPAIAASSPSLAAESASPMELTGILNAQPPGEWQAVMPLSLERVRVGFDAAVMLMRLIERAKSILRHKYPEGRLEDVLREALEILIERKDPQARLGTKEGETGVLLAPEPRFLSAWRGGRYIPARVKRAVWQRDDGRCTWRFEDGGMCGSRDALEFDHFRPFAKGGRSDDARNVRLLCRMHNRMAARTEGMLNGERAVS
jgi:HNH endonuclease